MAITIRWKDNSKIETGHRIYKSSTYFNKNNLPAPLATLDANITEYEDVDGAEGENWYIVSALLNDYEVYSEPFIAGLTTFFLTDFFTDNSGIATYNFDNDVNDLNSLYNAAWSGNEDYAPGLLASCLDFDGSSYVTLPPSIVGVLPTTYSFWIKTQSGVNTSDQNVITLSRGATNYPAKIRFNSNGTLELADFNGTFASVDGTKIVTDNIFHHIVLMLDGTNISMYVDNVLDAQKGQRQPVSTIDNIFLGANRGGTSPYMNGQFEQLRIFNRALTLSEIGELYNEGVQFV